MRLIPLFLLLFGCDGAASDTGARDLSMSGGTTGGTGGTSGGTGGTSGGTGGTTGGTTGGGAVDMATPAANTGYVSLTAYRAAQLGGIQGGYAYAGFSNGTGACTTMVQGPCKVTSCGSTTAVSAGSVSVSGTNVPVMLQPQGAGGYNSVMSSSAQLFDDGVQLTIAATGAAVPAFSASLTAPSRLLITTPAMGAGAITVQRSQGFTVAWSGASAGEVVVYLDGGAARGTQMFCRFSAAAGSGTIPAAALQLIPAGSGGFAMSSETSNMVRAGDWAVQLTASYEAVWSQDQTIVSGAVTYQ